jgi:hypothetical protein
VRGKEKNFVKNYFFGCYACHYLGNRITCIIYIFFPYVILSSFLYYKSNFFI